MISLSVGREKVSLIYIYIIYSLLLEIIPQKNRVKHILRNSVHLFVF
jgi:hypothetical protein